MGQMNLVGKKIAAALMVVVLVLVLNSCNQQVCPAYSKVVKPVVQKHV